jgi:uncharacterized protein (TIGR03085 family)
MTSLAHAERAALLALLAEVGPQAPTLCAGWRTHELAAHLVVRERRPQAVPGLVLPALHGVTERLEQRMRRRPYDELLAALREGPPAWSPLGAPGRLYDAGNLHEFYVHHEDVRRLVDPSPRARVAGLDEALWRRARLLARRLSRRAEGLAITLQTPQGWSLPARSGTSPVTVLGTAPELFLWLFGRRSVAAVEVSGPDEAVRALAEAHVGP